MSTRLFFGHLARGTSQRHLESFISDFGDIREVAVVDRYGFVDFRSPRDAADALRELNGKTFRGERIIVEYARSRGGPRERRDTRRGPPARSKHRIIVENVSSRATWKDLKDHMRRAGEVCFADVHRERPGEGIVEYERYDDFKYALSKLQDSEFFGKKIYLVDDSRSSSRSHRDRSPRRGRSGSRSPRQERNRSPRRGRSRTQSPRRERNHSRSPRRDRGSSRRESSRSPQRGSRRSASRSASPRRQSTRSRRSVSRSRSPKAYRSGSQSPANGEARPSAYKNGSAHSPKNSEGECTPPAHDKESFSPEEPRANGIDSKYREDSLTRDMA